MTLEEKRKEWEKSLVTVAEKQRDPGTFLVILRREKTLRDGKSPYFCHRYFSIGDNWEVSVDASNVDAEAAMKWALNPKAIPQAEFNEDED